MHSRPHDLALQASSLGVDRRFPEAVKAEVPLELSLLVVDDLAILAARIVAGNVSERREQQGNLRISMPDPRRQHGIGSGHPQPRQRIGQGSSAVGRPDFFAAQGRECAAASQAGEQALQNGPRGQVLRRFRSAQGAEVQTQPSAQESLGARAAAEKAV